MKSYLIIGMGKFGSYLCKSLEAHGYETLAVDEHEENILPLTGIATSTRIADCRSREALESFDVPSFDACIVCIGEDFQSSLEITDLLKELGAVRVLSMASSDTQAKFLLRNGADSVIFPERDTAERLSVSVGDDRVFEYFSLANGSSLYELITPRRWIGQSIVDVNVRARFGVNIAAIRRKSGAIEVPSATYVFCEEDHLWMLGRDEDVQRILKKAD